MTNREAIAILQIKKLSCCSQKEFVEAIDMAIEALRRSQNEIHPEHGES